MKSLAGKLGNYVYRAVSSERTQLKEALKIRPLQCLHLTTPPATVQHSSRCALEDIAKVRINEFMPGLSERAIECIHESFTKLISINSRTSRFPMQLLHGCTNSKSDPVTRPERAACNTMAEMGVLVDDLPDLDGLQGEVLIQACMRWRELRLHQGIKLYTDAWHQRFYWHNEGGSHHMAVLCRELIKQHRDWVPEVTIVEHDVHLSQLNLLDAGGVSVFVIRRGAQCGWQQLFHKLPKYLKSRVTVNHLGLALPNTYFPRFPMNKFQLVFIDHSRPYSDIVYSRLEEQINMERAMKIEDFVATLVSMSKS